MLKSTHPRHTLAVASDGRLFAWGAGKEGALGLGDKTTHPLPQPVQLPAGEQAKQVAAGAGFSIILTQKGHIYTCGKGDYGQLGQGER